MKDENFKIKELEEKHKEGYLKSPVKPGEFSARENEQQWGAGFQPSQSGRSFGIKRHVSELKE